MSYSSSRSFSSSVPSNIYSTQSTVAQQIAQTAAQLGQYTFNWAIQNYAATTAMTNQAVQQYLQMSSYGLNAAKQQLQQYQNQYVPEMQQLGQLAGTYSSTGREALNAGQAESASAQGTNAGLAAATQNLQSYGINPSSGMYGELQDAQRAAGGAAAAGAGNAAIQNTEAAGRQLLGQSIQVGEQLPGDVVNSLNSAYQGVAGAENATLANAQTGANLLDASNPFLSTAMSLKYPPVGNTQGSNSMSTSQPGQRSGSNGGGTGGGRGQGGYGQPRSVNPSQGGGNQGSTGGGRNLTTAGLGGGPTIRTVPGGGGGYFNNPGPLTQQDVNTSNQGSYQQPFNSDFNTPGTNYTSNFDPYSATAGQSALPVDNSSNAMPGGGTAITPDPFNMPSQFNNSGSGSPSGGSYPSPFDNSNGQGFGGGYSGQYQQQPQQQGGSYVPNVDNQANSLDIYTGAIPNTTPDNTPNYSPDNSGSGYSGQYQQQPQQQGGYSGQYQQQPQQQGGYSGQYQQQPQQPQGGYGGYAAGGAIPSPDNQTTGGNVSRHLSPSQGRQTDDIPARLNADEFVVPRDVAQWKGQEFFHKMIEQSRKARMGMTQQTQAQPKSKAPLPNQNRPKFVSRPMGAR